MISLLPPVHIALVDRERLLTGLDELLSILPRPADETSSMVLITGPSRTADIEQILVRGVHGPGEIHVVVVEGVGHFHDKMSDRMGRSQRTATRVSVRLTPAPWRTNCKGKSPRGGRLSRSGARRSKATSSSSRELLRCLHPVGFRPDRERPPWRSEYQQETLQGFRK